MIYARQSRGYRAGAEQLRSLTLNDNAPANPEIVNEQEVGIKTSLFDKRIRFNLAGYHNTVKGAQRSVILVVSGVQQTILENADTRNWGFEGELSATVTDGLDLFAGYAYTNPEYTKYDGYVVANNALTPFEKKEYAFVTIVKNQFMVGGTFTRDLGPVRLEANANYAWQDKMTQIAEPLAVLVRPAAQGGAGIGSTASAQALLDAGTTKSYGITNASIGLAFGPQRNYELTLWGRNVFDVRAKQYVLYLGGLNYVASSWNDPATYGVTARIKW
jgi:iron complex outermembrane receptor protein